MMSKLFPILLLAMLCGCTMTAVAETPTTDMPPQIRRIITTEGADGKSFVLADGTGSNTNLLNGSRIDRLWETAAMPVPIPVGEDLGKVAGNAYRPGFTGSSLYVADIPPGSDLSDIPLHKQESMDYIVVLSGEIDLVLDDGEVRTMRAGDVLIQAGNNHSWVNQSADYVRLLCVTLTAVRQP